MLHLFKTLDEQFERLLETASIDEAKSSSRLDNVPYCMQVSDDERARNIHLATPWASQAVHWLPSSCLFSRQNLALKLAQYGPDLSDKV